MAIGPPAATGAAAVVAGVVSSCAVSIGFGATSGPPSPFMAVVVCAVTGAGVDGSAGTADAVVFGLAGFAGAAAGCAGAVATGLLSSDGGKAAVKSSLALEGAAACVACEPIMR